MDAADEIDVALAQLVAVGNHPRVPGHEERLDPRPVRRREAVDETARPGREIEERKVGRRLSEPCDVKGASVGGEGDRALTGCDGPHARGARP